jgi:uncharacterized protein (DUF488 family)
MTGELPDIYTAGYGNRGFGAFIALVERFGITHLVDVRSVPQSIYWEDFRRQSLEILVPPTGLKYIYMGDTLGGVQDSPALCKDPDSVDINLLFEMPELAKGLDVLLKAAAVPGRVICLMCGCKKPHSCHRSRLLGEALLRRGIELKHIDSDDSVKLQTLVAQEQSGFQQSLF